MADRGSASSWVKPKTSRSLEVKLAVSRGSGIACILGVFQFVRLNRKTLKWFTTKLFVQNILQLILQLRCCFLTNYASMKSEVKITALVNFKEITFGRQNLHLLRAFIEVSLHCRITHEKRYTNLLLYLIWFPIKFFFY